MDDLKYAEGWRPEPGDILVGEVTDVAMGWSNFTNANYPIVTVHPQVPGAEPVAVHGFHSGLFNQLMQLKPVQGERIGIKYEGKRPHKTNPAQEVSVYIVKIDGRSADVWGQLAPSAPPAPATEAPATPPADAGDDIPFCGDGTTLPQSPCHAEAEERTTSTVTAQTPGRRRGSD